MDVPSTIMIGSSPDGRILEDPGLDALLLDLELLTALLFGPVRLDVERDRAA